MTVTLKGKNYLGLGRIVNKISLSLENKLPFSLVRVGDGENIVLAQEEVLTLEWISKNVGWSHSHNYCGITLPNLEARDKMINALKEADIIGVFAGDKLSEKIFSTYNIEPTNICYAFENLYMPMYKSFVDLLRKYPPLLVGRPAKSFGEFLERKLNIEIPGIVEINSYDDIDNCINAMSKIPHDWSLISAGCNALIISTTMASEFGKVSVDFGHAPNNVLSPKFPDYWLAVK